jgi:lysophospholipase L1-like esterase
MLVFLERQAAQTEQAGNILLPENTPGLKYEFRSGAPQNSYGYRERELALEKPPQLTRIAVLGDSVTYGAGVEEEQRYSRVLESGLQAHGLSEVQSLNFSVMGYDIESIVAMLRYRVLVYQPDLVIYGYYVNDQIPTELITISGHPLWVSTRARDFTVLTSALDRYLHPHSALFRQLEGTTASRAIAKRGQALSQWDWFEAQFAELVQLCQQQSIPLLVLLIPPHVFVQPTMSACNAAANQGPSFCEDNLKLMESALLIVEKYQVDAYDGGAAYRSGPVVELQDVAGDPHHPNAEGHRRLGMYLVPVVWEKLDHKNH